MKKIKGFVKAKGTKLIDGQGQPLLLRGVGLGSWLLPEGYMWCFPDQGDRPRRIEAMISKLVGEAKASEFWETYYHNYISEKDIKKIADDGFNSVRVPINSRFLMDSNGGFIERHFQYLDQLIDWCRWNNLYVILDLHGAPGGQTGTNIDDSPLDLPELFLDPANKQLTISLWTKLAERYQNEDIIAGYDLLNEPLPNWFSQYNHLVMPLYEQLIVSIRCFDKHHMIILEGVHWSTDWSIFDRIPDSNCMLQFHKYWSNPDKESIQQYLDIRNQFQVPIFMGEGGENNNEWYTGVFKLYETYEISWNFWTWKKMNTTNSPCSILMPSGWNQLIQYLDSGVVLDPSAAECILWEYLDNMQFDRCIYLPSVANALFSRANVVIPAIFYDYGQQGIGYGKRHRDDASSRTRANFRIGDSINICFEDKQLQTPNFQHMRGEAWQQKEWMHVVLDDGDWVCYSTHIEQAQDLPVHINACADIATENPVSARLQVISDEQMVAELQLNDIWSTQSIWINAAPGVLRIRLKAIGNSARVKYIVIGHV